MSAKYVVCIFFASAISISSIAQRTITGRVWADSTKPLAGVTVEIENTVVSTLTDKNGNYAISAGDDAVLVFKLKGYRTQEIQVHGRSIIDVNLERSSFSYAPGAGKKNRAFHPSQPCHTPIHNMELTEQVFDIVPGKLFYKPGII